MKKSRLLDSIPRIRHGFGSAAALLPDSLQPYWPQRPEKRQVHGTRVAMVQGAQQQVGEADGFVTATPGVPVSVITADCVPLLLARRDGAVVAAVHAGWRGLYDGIIGLALAQLAGAPGDYVAALGPTICCACYEVSAELAQDFVQRFGAAAVPRHRHLDLRAVAEQQLRAGGVHAIEHVGGCTCCTRDAGGAPVYRSYRRGDRGSQMHAGLYITPEETT